MSVPVTGYTITPALLMAVGASAMNAKLYAPLLEAARVVKGDSFNTISSKNGIAMLAAQLGHESGGFSTTTENLNYSVAALRLGNRAYYFTPADAKKYGYVKDSTGTNYLQRANQEMIGNLYYGGRLGNMGISTGDGWRFRGAGLIQTTGRRNFALFGAHMGMTAEQAADYARTPQGAVDSALWYWRENKLLVPASQGDVTVCTHIIQGGDGNLADRIGRFKAALAAMG